MRRGATSASMELRWSWVDASTTDMSVGEDCSGAYTVSPRAVTCTRTRMVGAIYIFYLLHYINHNSMPFLLGGDFTQFNGRGGESIYGEGYS